MTREEFVNARDGIKAQIESLEEQGGDLIERFLKANTLPPGTQVRHQRQIFEIESSHFTAEFGGTIRYIARDVAVPERTKALYLGTFDIINP